MNERCIHSFKGCSGKKYIQVIFYLFEIIRSIIIIHRDDFENGSFKNLVSDWLYSNDGASL